MSMKLGLLTFAVGIAAVAMALVLPTLNNQPQQTQKKTIGGLTIEDQSPKRDDKVIKTEAEWKRILTPEQYKISRGKGTEAAFCGGYLNNKETGVYHCVACDLPLFKSDTKFESGTGWPSFFQPYSRENVWLKTDNSYGMQRVEVLCARCDGHLGHVFDDGPKDKTGIRYCINSEILKFRKAK
ncbi:MAG: peptide-methionine (R)-S-oxide reductase MsrB [Fimbriimonadaceae bacterium]|nr:peptide-methionine (R)-S-oxide reductase MsrB [Fimbriimonadaceae bacterium]